jgi:hypothetical protein
MRAKLANVRALQDIHGIHNIDVDIEDNLKIVAQSLIPRVNVDIEENINIVTEIVMLTN